MKNFLQTRVVKARSMRRGEYNALTGLEQLTVNEGKEEGYLCETGTHITWLPKEEFELISKPCETFEERLDIEHEELQKKTYLLYKFLESEKFEELPEAERRRIKVQYNSMSSYLYIIEERITAIKKTGGVDKNEKI